MKQATFRTDVLPMKDKIFRLALRITLNRADAEDVVQDTLIKIWNKRDRWDEIESLEAWALTIARNLAIDCTRKRDAHPEEEITPPQALETTTPYERLREKERIELVRNLMNALPEKQRTAMQLRDFEGKSYREISEIMQVTEEQVKVSIFRARQFIKLKYSQIYDAE